MDEVRLLRTPAHPGCGGRTGPSDCLCQRGYAPPRARIGPRTRMVYASCSRRRPVPPDPAIAYGKHSPGAVRSGSGSFAGLVERKDSCGHGESHFRCSGQTRLACSWIHSGDFYSHRNSFRNHPRPALKPDRFKTRRSHPILGRPIPFQARPRAGSFTGGLITHPACWSNLTDTQSSKSRVGGSWVPS